MRTSIKLLVLLIELSQRLGHRSNFLFLYGFIKDSGYSCGSRIEAAALYYEFGLDSEELLHRITPIHDYLQLSFIEEGDSEYLVLNCFVNYFHFVVQKPFDEIVHNSIRDAKTKNKKK